MSSTIFQARAHVGRILPSILIGFRALAAPGIIIAERMGAGNGQLVALLIAAFISDLLDGIIARRLGIATERLRQADSLVDTVFYAAALIALSMRAPHAVWSGRWGIAAVLILEVVRFVVEWRRFGRMAAYHMWSAKLWGIALIFGFSEVFFTHAAGPLFWCAIILGIVTDFEGLAASLILSTWRHDVPSLLHAVRLERSVRERGFERNTERM